MKTFLIVDGHGLAYRAYFALTKANLTAPDGTPTGALVGTMNMLYKVVDDVKPDCVIVAFDAGGKTFRHDLQTDYKANRKKSPDDFRTERFAGVFGL